MTEYSKTRVWGVCSIKSGVSISYPIQGTIVVKSDASAENNFASNQFF